jgi:riboflavin synthase
VILPYPFSGFSARGARYLDERAPRHYIALKLMFTGLVTTVGTLGARHSRGPGARMALTARFDDGPLALGESVAVNGACLTVDAITGDGFEIDASGETLARTTLGGLKVGSTVHLERALRAADRMGGHIVTGHVDGLGSLLERRSAGESLELVFRVPSDLAPFVAEKGSITVEGVSLTVNAAGRDRFDVTIIPHTLSKTHLGELQPGDPVNLEVDLIARYVGRLLAFRA